MLQPTKSDHTATAHDGPAASDRERAWSPDEYERHTTSFLLPFRENGVQHVVSFQYSESGFVLLLGN